MESKEGQELFQRVDFPLEILQELSCVGAVHLGVVELEGDRQGIPEPMSAVSAPEQEGVVEDTAVHTNNAVNFSVHNGRSADDHGVFRQVTVLAALGHLGGVSQIVFVEFSQIIGIENVAGADFTGFVLDDGVDSEGVVLYQLVPHGKGVEFLDGRGGFADAVVQQHVEFQIFLRDSDEIGYV